jgi:DNA-binding transcriptional regulator LsrR (DeoR family)
VYLYLTSTEGRLVELSNHEDDERASRPTLTACSLRTSGGRELTQSEIGSRLGLSQMHISRLLRQASDKLVTTAAE